MKLVYAKNCDIFYDSVQEMIVLSKRGKNFAIKKPREDIKIIKNIIRLCQSPCDLEELYSNFSQEKRRVYSQYTKLLWQKKILVEVLPEFKILKPELLEFIIGNYDGDPRLIQYLAKTDVVFLGEATVISGLRRFGLRCSTYTEGEQDESERLYIGTFTKQQCEHILNGKNKVILCREREGTSYILYLDHYDEEKYMRFESFVWKENATFYNKQSILPFNIIMLFSDCFMRKDAPELLCIASDGTVHTFFIKRLVNGTSSYFNRETIPTMNRKNALINIEKLPDIAPYLFDGCNVNNNSVRQSPICCYEIVFGSDFERRAYISYHEDYVEAGCNAFCDGLEQMLNLSEQDKWSCGVNLDDYYAKGYISLLEHTDECYKIRKIDRRIAERIQYLNDVLNTEVGVYYNPSPVESIGGIVLCDTNDNILYEGKLGYCLREDVLKGIYALIGETQKVCVVDKKGKLTEKYTILGSLNSLPEELDSQQAITQLQQHYIDIARIVDDRIWAYQVQIQDTGMHVGEFFFIR